MNNLTGTLEKEISSDSKSRGLTETIAFNVSNIVTIAGNNPAIADERVFGAYLVAGTYILLKEAIIPKIESLIPQVKEVLDWYFIHQ